MLVITRKLSEVVYIGDSIVIKVVGIDEGQVKLGIEAPKETRILRAELRDEISRENRRATQTGKTAAVQAARMLRVPRKDAPPQGGPGTTGNV